MNYLTNAAFNDGR
ncbi:hypothetical protein EYZ11_004131 [Aspergillus tanneri]|uniref:Uncharacterized protein n=1 Tax=Aspergillus tanneri TaxID=1220188 RepID=A0A4S3JNR0_9EURO|nr:hypothetical protein EYZ11_004131 [Aspergillus tanneri]